MTTWLVSEALLHFLWQGCVILLLTEGVLTQLDSARSRYLAACVGLATMALSPVWTVFWLGMMPPVRGLVGPVHPGGSGDLFFRVWSVGVGLLCLRLMVDQLVLHRLRASGVPAPPAVQAQVRELLSRWGSAMAVEVRVVADLAAPVAVGILRPAILLPATALTGLSSEQLRAVLAHELAHIRRFDAVVNLLQVLVETGLYYHPAVWWLSQRIREEREVACDEAAVEACGDPLLYARALTRLEVQRGLTLRLSNAATGGSLMTRIQRIVGQTPPSRRPSWVLPAVGLAAAIGLVGVAVANPGDTAEPVADEEQVEEAATEVHTWVSDDGTKVIELKTLGVELDLDGPDVFVMELDGEELDHDAIELMVRTQVHQVLGGDHEGVLGEWVGDEGHNVMIREFSGDHEPIVIRIGDGDEAHVIDIDADPMVIRIGEGEDVQVIDIEALVEEHTEGTRRTKRTKRRRVDHD